MDLSKLDFGAPAAERDVLHGLKSYFLESESYQRFKNGQKTVLLGNRGAGKSAIFKMLAEYHKMRGDTVIELTPEDYSYEMLNQSMTRESEGAWAKQGAYAASWKYLIYVLAMKKILEKSPSLKKKGAKTIFNYLRDNHRGFQQNPLDILISYLKRLEGIKLGFAEASVKVRQLQYLYKLEEISGLIPILEEVCRKTPAVIFIDELDRGWDASEDAKAFVAGLFQAAVAINDTMKNFRVFISLRQELYDNIPSLYEDAQKVWDLIEVIKWDKQSLKNLVARRIQHSLPELAQRSVDKCWQAVFARVFHYVEEASFDYLIDRTLYRPREIIQFSTQSKEKALEMKEYPITYSSVSAVEIDYSEHRTKDIASEYRFQYPGLASVFEAFRGRDPVFSSEALEDLCIRISLREIPTSSQTAWLEEQDPEYLINVLWKVGFLRAKSIAGMVTAETPESFLGPHQVSTLNLRNIKQFDVHPMFRSYLGMDRSSSRPTP